MRNKEQQLKILFLTASSGGGHNGLLRGIEEELSPHLEVFTRSVDLYDVCFIRPLRWLSGIRKYLPMIWALALKVSDSQPASSLLIRLYHKPLLRRLTELVHQQCPEQPDIIIALHHISAHCLEGLAASYAVRPRTLTYISDYEPHWFWIAKSDMYVVASRKAQARLLLAGAEPTSIFVRQFLHAKKPCADKALRKLEGAKPFKVLIAGGADGARSKKIIAILEALESLCLSAPNRSIHVTVVCGKNYRLQRKLQRVSLTSVDLRIDGFIENFPDTLQESDLAVVRAGPQTVTEAVFAKVPVVIFDWYAHELANCLKFERLKLAKRITDPRRIAESIARMAEGTDLDYARMKHVSDNQQKRFADLSLLEILVGAEVVDRIFLRRG